MSCKPIFFFGRGLDCEGGRSDSGAGIGSCKIDGEGGSGLSASIISSFMHPQAWHKRRNALAVG